jgi:hypothetical protein
MAARKENGTAELRHAPPKGHLPAYWSSTGSPRLAVAGYLCLKARLKDIIIGPTR